MSASVHPPVRHRVRGGRRVLVLKAGGSASGKSFLGQRLARRAASGLQIVEGAGVRQATAGWFTADRFYKPLNPDNTPVDHADKAARIASGEANFDVPQAFDMDLIFETVVRLLAGESTHLPHYSYADCTRSQGELFAPVDILVVDGLFAFHDQRLRDLAAALFYVRAPRDVRIERRLARDLHPETGRYKTREQAMPTFQQALEMHDLHVAPAARHADHVFDNPFFQGASFSRPGPSADELVDDMFARLLVHLRR